MQIEVRDMIPEDWPDVREIYRQGVDSGDATFEHEIPGWGDWNASRAGLLLSPMERSWDSPA